MSANVVKKLPYLCRKPCLSAQHSTYCRRRQTIAEKNATINAFVSVSQYQPSSLGEDRPLTGLTVAVKDNIATRLLPTTCSSAILQDFTSPFDATVVELLQKSGADVIGKTNCDEFGMGSLNTHSVHGPVKNPINPQEERSAGGSSGGSAAAVAAGMCDAALGTDTGGSVRLPASYCGVVGMKPSYGLLSRWGVVSYADSLDCVGILAANVPTAKRVFDVISPYDPLDPTAAPPDIREKAFSRTRERLARQPILKGLKVGIPQEYFPSELSHGIIEHFRGVITQLQSEGAIVIPISLPSTAYALSSYYVLASAEASSNLARYDGVQYGSHTRPPLGTNLTKTSNVYASTRSTGFGLEVQKRILLGTYALSADAFDNYFLQAQRIRQLVKNDFNRVFSMPNDFSDPSSMLALPEKLDGDESRVDVLLHPSAIKIAPLLSESSSDSDLSAYVQDVLTVPASLAGLPALSIPVAKVDGQWPVGISIVGQWGTDEMVLAVGKGIEDLLVQG